MKLKIIGCGEAFDAQGFGNNACVLYGNGPTVLFDCGYQIPERLWKHPQIYKTLEAIYFTHTHADHSFGFVPLIAQYCCEGRRKKLHIFGPKGIQSFLTKIMKAGYPNLYRMMKFKLIFKELKNEDRFTFQKLKFECAKSIHSVTNLSVKVTLPHKKSFAISGDGSLSKANERLYQNTDLLLHECYWVKQKEYYHSSLEAMEELARKAQIKKIVLTHQSMPERKAIEKKVRKMPAHFVCAKPNQEFNLL